MLEKARWKHLREFTLSRESSDCEILGLEAASYLDDLLQKKELVCTAPGKELN
jgi:hypothetical protein